MRQLGATLEIKMDFAKHFRNRMTQAEIDEALMAKMDADEKEIKRLREDREDLIRALEYAVSVFDGYITLHLNKTPPDYDKAANNERHRKILSDVITRSDTPPNVKLTGEPKRSFGESSERSERG